jgi:CubicO group peptidase (beta-lactamase class C family)
VLLLAACTLVGCTPATETDPAPDMATVAAQEPSSPRPSFDRAALSQRVLDRLVTTPEDGPGCAAAVGGQGQVVWYGTHGMADIEAGTPISESTVFGIASVTKQFTAAMILMLAAENELDLDDAVSAHVDGLPSWGDDVTLDQLIHHTSGVPDYEAPLVEQGHETTEPVGRRAILKAIVGTKKLDFEPGTDWAYSNAGYVLLGYVIEAVTGKPLDEVLTERVFEPLRLDMVLEPVDHVGGQARAYGLDAGEYVRLGWPWDIAGASGIQSTVADLVRWGDNYRTGTVGGRQLLDAQVADPVEVAPDDDWRYGAGIFVLPDGSVVHDGDWAGFHTRLQVSADRGQVLVVACNFAEANVDTISYELTQLWVS